MIPRKSGFANPRTPSNLGGIGERGKTMEFWQIIVVAVYLLIGVIIQLESQKHRQYYEESSSGPVIRVGLENIPIPVIRAGVAILWLPILLYLCLRAGPSRVITEAVRWILLWIPDSHNHLQL